VSLSIPAFVPSISISTSTSTSTATATASDNTAAPAQTPVEVAPIARDPEQDVTTDAQQPDVDRFEALLEKVLLLASVSKDLLQQVKLLQKDFSRLQKEKAKAEAQSAKIQSRREKKATKQEGGGAAKRSPSGFAKPTKLSDQLCEFLKVPSGTEMARTDVTRLLNGYIKAEKLQDDKDKRKILPNIELQKILSPGEVTYFNLQSKLKHHFVKA